MKHVAHLSLEGFNLLIEGKAAGAVREQLADHLLDCDVCARRFRALRRFRDDAVDMGAPARPKQPRRIPLRYVLGVAAVMIMGLSPYLTRGPQSQAAEFMAAANSPGIHRTASFSVLAEIERVNYDHALQEWGRNTDLTDLVSLQNRFPN